LVERAKADRYGQEAETVRLFWRLAARFAGDMTMAFLATGGVTFSGGVLPRLIDFLDPAVFRARYEDKAPFGELLRNVGTRIIMVDDAVLYGLGAIAASPERYAIDYETRAWCIP
jgi:glucokinase